MYRCVQCCVGLLGLICKSIVVVGCWLFSCANFTVTLALLALILTLSVMPIDERLVVINLSRRNKICRFRPFREQLQNLLKD